MIIIKFKSKNESTYTISLMITYPIPNMNKDCNNNFKVNFDLGGFLKYINNKMTAHKKKKILQPVKSA